MKRTTLLLFILFLYSHSVYSQDYLQKGDDYFKQGNYEKAKRNYEACLIYTNHDTSKKICLTDSCIKLLNKANEYYKINDYFKAKEKYTNLLNLNPNDQYAIKQLSLCTGKIRPIIIEEASSIFDFDLMEDVYDEWKWDIMGDNYFSLGIKCAYIGIDGEKYHFSQFGLLANFIISSKLELQPEILYDYKNNYFQIPINLRYGFAKLGPVIPIVSAGPFLGIYKKESYKETSSGINSSLGIGYDIGVNTGIGIDIWKFQLMANYTFGFLHLKNDKIKSQYKGFSVSLAFLFY